ncbi:MAG: hypothetical protein IKD01_06400, partial [Oscillospiraceae bacterium]|nr:hypothetical protein [Oscillospiraceae bacterium]
MGAETICRMGKRLSRAGKTGKKLPQDIDNGRNTAYDKLCVKKERRYFYGQKYHAQHDGGQRPPAFIFLRSAADG